MFLFSYFVQVVQGGDAGAVSSVPAVGAAVIVGFVAINSPHCIVRMQKTNKEL